MFEASHLLKGSIFDTDSQCSRRPRSAAPLPLVFDEGLRDIWSRTHFSLHHCPHHHTQLAYQLEFLRGVMPPVVIADRMSWEEILLCVPSACAMGQHMIRLPFAFNFPTADMTPGTGFREDAPPVR